VVLLQKEKSIVPVAVVHTIQIDAEEMIVLMKFNSNGYEICPECCVGHDLIHRKWITIGNCPCGCKCPIKFVSKRKSIITKEHHGCSDGGCVFGHPGGMHTNGGCKCIPIRFHSPHERIQLRKAIVALRKERDKLFDILKEKGE
jgi:hypothetical protein